MTAGGSHDVSEGVFSLFAMAHTMTFAGPAGAAETVPWDGLATGGPYSYAAMPCTGDAPVNNVSSDLPALGGEVTGARAPASTRTHPMRFDVAQDGATFVLDGSLTLTVCHLRPGPTRDPDPVPDHVKPRIAVAWQGRVDRRTPELVSFRGRFAIVGGAGGYERLRGEGDIAGYFFCFDPHGCAALGAFRDCQYALIGSFRVPRDAAVLR